MGSSSDSKRRILLASFPGRSRLQFLIAFDILHAKMEGERPGNEARILLCK